MRTELPNQCEDTVSWTWGSQNFHQTNHIHVDSAFSRTPRRTAHAQWVVASQSLQKIDSINVTLPLALPGLTEYSPRGALQPDIHSISHLQMDHGGQLFNLWRLEVRSGCRQGLVAGESFLPDLQKCAFSPSSCMVTWPFLCVFVERVRRLCHVSTFYKDKIPISLVLHP